MIKLKKMKMVKMVVLVYQVIKLVKEQVNLQFIPYHLVYSLLYSSAMLSNY